MKIAQISKPWLPIPPLKYGGIERIVSFLAEEQKKDHDVTVFAPGGCQLSRKIKVVSLYSEGQGDKGLDRNTELAQSLHAVKYHLEKGRFDILHAHSVDPILAIASVIKLPLVFTFHSNPTPANKILSGMGQKNVNFVFVSRSHRKSFPWIKKAFVVYNGLPVGNYPFSAKKEDYLITIGSIAPFKGIVEAIETANRARTPLIIAGKIREENRGYFDKEVKPRLEKSKYAKFIGEITEKRRNELVKQAKGFLFPVKWQEPFSTSVLESLAVGTPVVAFNRGSIPEVIEDGKNGFIVENVSEMTRVVSKLEKINPLNCRRTIKEVFNSKAMSENYIKIYNKILHDFQK